MNDLLYLFQLSEYEIAPSFRRRLRRKRCKRQYLPSAGSRFRSLFFWRLRLWRMRHVDGCRIDPRQRFRRNILPQHNGLRAQPHTLTNRQCTINPGIFATQIALKLQIVFKNRIARKPERHHLERRGGSEARRSMNEIGG